MEVLPLHLINVQEMSYSLKSFKRELCFIGYLRNGQNSSRNEQLGINWPDLFLGPTNQ